MNLYLCLALCIIPFVICFVFFKFFSTIKLSTEIFASFLGFVAVVPISFLQFLIVSVFFEKNFTQTAMLPIFLRAVIFNGFVEEFIKMLFLVFIPKKKISYNNFFMAAILFGLCLGCFESVIYFLQRLQEVKPGAQLIYHIVFIRMFTSDLIHTFCAALSAIFIISIIQKNIDFLALVFSILGHGMYDFFAGLPSNLKYISFVAIAFVIIETRIRYQRNKPDLEEYKKDETPSRISKDKTIETVLKKTPVSLEE